MATKITAIQLEALDRIARDADEVSTVSLETLGALVSAGYLVLPVGADAIVTCDGLAALDTRAQKLAAARNRKNAAARARSSVLSSTGLRRTRGGWE